MESKQSPDLDIQSLKSSALQFTNDRLRFTFSKISSNPNISYYSERANCVGYSAMMASICQYYIQKNGMDEKMEVIHSVGQLYAFGINVHSPLFTSFFKDHDFVIIKNKSDQKTISIDPSLSDYFFIDQVTMKSK